MTKSTITRERIEQYANDPRMCNVNDEIREMARMALAAMDSEPVADVVAWSHPTEERTCDIRWRRHDVEPGPLYRHKQQPSVPDRSIFEKWWESQNGAPLDGWDSLRTTDGYCDDGIDGQFEAWNAAMLAAAPQEAKGE
ncbi:hypothetical protein ACOV22_003204 [Klebsiella michiganensis]